MALGSLMNARGLMALIVMKIGLDASVIGPEVFTMLMIMAIVTTVMTTPLMNLFAGRAPIAPSPAAAPPGVGATQTR